MRKGSPEDFLSVEDIRRFVVQHGVDCEILDRGGYVPPPFVVQAKTLIFLVGARDVPVCVITRAIDRVCARRVARHEGERQARLADPEFAERITGFPRGSIPPFSHRHSLRTLIDAALMPVGAIAAGAADPTAVFVIRPHDLQRACAAAVGSFSSPATSAAAAEAGEEEVVMDGSVVAEEARGSTFGTEKAAGKEGAAEIGKAAAETVWEEGSAAAALDERGWFRPPRVPLPPTLVGLHCTTIPEQVGERETDRKKE